MKKDFEILKQRVVYDGFFKLESYQFKHTLFKGGWSNSVERELFRRNNCVAALLYDPVRDEVVLIEQFRVGTLPHQRNAWLLEIVAGGIESGETPEEVVHREAFEEAGCKIEELLFINTFYTSPGGTSERLSLFCGKVDTTHIGGIFGLEEENEDILVTTVSAATAFQWVSDGKIESAIPIIAIQWLQLNHETLRKKWL